MEYGVWRRGDLVVSALHFRSGGRWVDPSLCRRVVSLDKKRYSTLSLFTQLYKWVPAIIILWGDLVMDHHSSRGSSYIPSRGMVSLSWLVCRRYLFYLCGVD